MKFYTHKLVMPFEAGHSQHEDWRCMPQWEILDAVRARMDYLEAHPDAFDAAFGFRDTAEEDAARYRVTLYKAALSTEQTNWDVEAGGFIHAEQLVRKEFPDCVVVQIRCLKPVTHKPVKETRKWWCTVHRRDATSTRPNGDACCDPKLGGIMMPCQVVPVPRPR